MEFSFDGYNFGAIQSPPDYRDLGLADVVSPVSVPDTFFIDISNLPIWNQKKIGSCGGHMISKYDQKLEEIEKNQIINVSPRFAYALAKCVDGYSQEGTYLRVLLKNGVSYGFATENTVPNNCDLTHEEYVYNRKLENIPKEAFDEAQHNKFKSYAWSGLSLPEIKQAIYQGNGCALLVRVGNPWWTDVNGNVTWNPTGLFPLRPPQVITGGHFIYPYGFRLRGDGKTEIHFVNSWSALWGSKGAGWFVYEDYAPFINECATAVDLPDDVIQQVKSLPSVSEFKHNFSTDIVFGQTSDEVKALQIALKIDGSFPKTIKETGFYGEITRQAVKAFQAKHKVASPLEIAIVNGRRAGQKTRQFLNVLFNR